MELQCSWKDKVYFETKVGHHLVGMDTKAPIGSDLAASPKELLLSAICGCTGMDVVSLLRKGRQMPASFAIEANADLATGHPAVFKSVRLKYRVEGEVGEDLLRDAVKKSMTQYCSVSAMVSKSCPIMFTIDLNGKTIGDGQANFE